MPRVHHVKRARKAIKEYGIKKGDAYYWWKFRRGGKRISLTPPRPSQLTQSEYLCGVLSEQETVEDAVTDCKAAIAEALSTLADTIRDAASNVQQLGEDQRDKASNMESAFPSGCPTIDQLNERGDRADELAQELESAADSLPDADGLDFSEIEGVSWDAE